MSNRPKILPWAVVGDNIQGPDQAFYESILAQGNGYMGVRGFDPAGPKENGHERSVFLAGFFEYIKAGITDMVNTPDLFAVRFGFPCKRVWASARLDMDTGLLTWEGIWETEDRLQFSVTSRRVVSMANPHAAALEVEITSLNGDLELALETGLDGDVANLPISDDQLAQNTTVHRLLFPVTCAADRDGGLLIMESRPSEQSLYQAYRVKANRPMALEGVVGDAYTAVRLRGTLPKGEVLRVEKFIATYSSRDEHREPAAAARDLAAQLAVQGFGEVLEESSAAWNRLWGQCDVELDSELEELQGAVRYNIFQLLQNNASHDPRVSIGARGLMHGRYKGNYFWDTEIFMLPFYLCTRPEAARNLLLYRYHTLDDARESARGFGLKGARYSWMCSRTGFEQCETWDTGCCEVHITADVAHAVQRYVEVTGDEDFLVNYGAEILLETTRYWVSRLTYDPRGDHYNLLFVKGPDEYCGVTNNNTYTNFLVRENLLNAVGAVRALQEYPEAWEKLQSRLGVSQDELALFGEVAGKIPILYDEGRELFIQDENFERLEPLDIEAHKEGAVPLYRTISYDRLQRYRVLKQADLVLLMAMFPERFSYEQKRNVWEYYEPLTLHDSSLSFGTHAQLAAMLGYEEQAVDYFAKSAFLDLHNIMDNVHKEGIHMAALGATWQALVFGMAGLSVDQAGSVRVNPRLPKEIRAMRLSVVVRGRRYRLAVEGDQAQVTAL